MLTQKLALIVGKYSRRKRISQFKMPQPLLADDDRTRNHRDVEIGASDT